MRVTMKKTPNRKKKKEEKGTKSERGKVLVEERSEEGAKKKD